MNKILVVYKKSIVELYEKSGDEPVKTFMQSDSTDVIKMKKSDELQKRTLEVVLNELNRKKINYDAIFRANLKEIKDYNLVITVGGDGTFLEVSHYIKNSNIPVLVINSDPIGSIGFYSCGTKDNFAKILDILDNLPRQKLNRFSIYKNNNKIPEYILNDVLFANTNPAATTRFKIKDKEYIKNSGLLVCTALGSTAWMYNEGGTVMPLNDERLQYQVLGQRERKFSFAKELKIESLTRQAKFYIDGPNLRYDFEIGSVVDIRLGEPITVIGNLNEKRVKYL